MPSPTPKDEMRNNGIVAVGDICNNTSTLPQKQKQNLAYYNFIEVSGWVPQVAQIRFERSLAFYNAFEESSKLKTNFKIVCRRTLPIQYQNELWELIIRILKTKRLPSTTRKPFEDSLFEKGEGDFTRMYGMMKMDTSFFNQQAKAVCNLIFKTAIPQNRCCWCIILLQKKKMWSS
jgi:hypothetical protein